MKGKKNLPLYREVEITDLAAEGKSVARVDNMVVFVQDAVPGDVADLQVFRKRRRFMEARPVKYHKFSANRVKPICEHFGVCGGCKWQHLNYSEQLYYKQKQVKDNLERIGKVNPGKIEPILPSAETTFYRNKLEFTFSNKRWLLQEEVDSTENFNTRNALGFHIPGRFDKVLDINKCWLQVDVSNQIRNKIRQYALDNNLEFFDLKEQQGFLRNLIIRTTTRGEVMVILSFYRDDKDSREALLDFIHDEFQAVTSLMYVINPKGNDSIGDLDVQLYKGKEYITEEMEGLQFRISPKSFYQTNPEQAHELYKIVRNLASLTGNENVYDLYTGTGTIANFIARSAKKVTGIEFIPEVIDNAKVNSRINGIENTRFYAGDIKDVLTREFMEENDRPDVVVLDPPRAGVHQNVIDALLFALPARIVYVSCNPATQARDIDLLSGYYKVTRVQPVDMFPHTYHVENVALLERI